MPPALGRAGTGTPGTNSLIASAQIDPPTPQDASPCVFLSAVAGARGGGCSVPPQAERRTSANRTQRVHGSTPGPGEEEEDVPSKQAMLERKINKQAASSAALAEGEWEPRAEAGGGAGSGAG